MILLDTGMRKMPDKCSLCNFFRVESQMYCTAVVGYTTVSKPYERRPVWCPLHEVSNNSPELDKENGELISRQDAIEHLKKRLYESALNNEGVVSETMEEIADNRIQIWMDELPSSPSRSQWIPCSERMPDEEVLCCDTRGEMIIGYPYQDEESSTGYGAVLDDVVMIDCIAWMPLPEPYKGADA